MRQRPRQLRAPLPVFALLAALLVAAGAAAAAGPADVPEGDGPAPDLAESDPLYDDDYASEEETDNDPLEPANRAIFAVNRGLDWALFDPLTRGYQFLVPDPARRALFRAFRNLDSPSTFVNDVFQLRFRDAGETLGRFVLNSTLGAGGLFDAGLEMGWEPHVSDFGQTLGHYGVGAGPYLVLPILGPSTLRDGFGSVVDGLMQPLTYIIGPGQLLTITLPIGTGRGFTMRDVYSEKLNALEESSVDFYAALRSAYLQSRRAHIQSADGKGTGREGMF